MQIRPAILADAAAIARVGVDTWRATYRGIITDDYLDQMRYEPREQGWARQLDDPASAEYVIVAEDDTGQVVGYASCGPNRDAQFLHQSELSTIYLLPAAQGQGVGKRLFLACVDHLIAEGMTSMILWAFAENRASRGFYEAMGGQLVSEGSFYPVGGVDYPDVAYGWDDLRAVPR